MENIKNLNTEVPLPESDYWANPKTHLDYTRETLIAYGAACEAAGYIKGVKAENKRCKQILIEKMKHYDVFPDRAIAAQCFDHAQSLLGGCAYDAALQIEVKPIDKL